VKTVTPTVRTGILTFTRVERETEAAVKLRLETGRYVWVPKEKVIGGWQKGMEEGGAIKVPGWLAERL